jgi:hypothetical protein
MVSALEREHACTTSPDATSAAVIRCRTHAEAGLRPSVLALWLALLCVMQVDLGRCHTSHPHALDNCTITRHWPPGATHIATALAATPCP